METLRWNALPSLALHQIFMYLSPESRVAASSTCKHWRTALYHPLFWHSLVLDISPNGSSHCDVKSKVKHANEHLVTLVRSIHLKFDSRSTQCFELASSVVKTLLDNQLLKNIEIELNHCEFLKNKIFQDSSVQFCTYKWSVQNYFEFAILNVVQKGNIEGFSFGYFMFYYWYALIHMLAKYSCHSLKRLELAGLGPSIFNDDSKTMCFNSTFDCMSSLINLKKLSLDLNFNTYKLLPALCSMSQLEILVLHINNELDVEINDDIWADLKKYCPKLELRLTIINCQIVAKYLHTKILRPSMPLTHLKVLFCSTMNIQVLRKLLDYKSTLQSLIWVDEHSMNPTCFLRGHLHIDSTSLIDNETNPLIILSWICNKLTELVILGYFIDPVDVCGIARLRGPNLKRYELLDEDICFNQPRSIIYHKVVTDVSSWMITNWKPLNKNSTFVSRSGYILDCISKDLTA